MQSSSTTTDTACESCGGKLRDDIVSLALWSGDGLVVIENVPASVCDQCVEQFYDESTQSKIRSFVSNGFSKRDAVREMTVPVFSLEQEGVPEVDERRIA